MAYDTAFARTLFTAAGWVDRNGDGILDKDGRPVCFTASVGTFGSDKLAVHAQAQLRRVGVQMDMQLLDDGLMEAKLRTDDFEAWICGWTASTD